VSDPAVARGIAAWWGWGFGFFLGVGGLGGYLGGCLGWHIEVLYIYGRERLKKRARKGEERRSKLGYLRSPSLIFSLLLCIPFFHRLETRG